MHRWALLLAIAVSGCGSKVSVGDACFATQECDGDLKCVNTDVGRQCMRTCESTAVFCDDGEACIPSDDDAELFVCLPGGDTEIGDGCDSSVECALGAVCAGSSTRVCAAACDPTGSDCSSGQSCTASGSRGYCVDAV
ncbi:MAG: hypothetical protein R3A47_01615 [Polyangiales bacterium]